jgi:hypothetical protein
MGFIHSFPGSIQFQFRCNLRHAAALRKPAGFPENKPHKKKHFAQKSNQPAFAPVNSRFILN